MNSQIKVQNDRILNLFLDRLRARLGSHLRQVILFGSRARGEDVSGSDYAGSDYDCMAVLDILSPFLNDLIDETAGDFLYEYNAVFSVFPVSEHRYRKEIHNPLFMNVRAEGILL